MTPAFFIFSFLVIWHITLFVMLPVKGWGWKKKVLVNTLFALFITIALHFLLLSGSVPLRHAL